MYNLLRVFLILAVGITVSGCAADREYARMHVTLEVDSLFRQGTMLPQYRYFYNGPKSEPIALLALDRSCSFTSKFWTEFDDERQLQVWIREFQRLTGDWDDIEYVRYDYQGIEILGKEHERIGMAYSRYHWLVAWWGDDGELVIPSPSPSKIQRGPLMRRRW